MGANMNSIPIAEFRKNILKYLGEGNPFLVTIHKLPVAKVVPIEIKVENKVWPTCEMGKLNPKLSCQNDSNGKYRVTYNTDTDTKHWELNLCPDHVKVIEGKRDMEVEKL
jgi:antitoxin (DNA-binding transcriptional repressor) of toxin-antitoxin stability system